GTKRLFRQAGFRSITVYSLHPHYAEYDRVVSLEDNTQLTSHLAPRSPIKRLGKLLLAKSGVMRHFASSFGVVASQRDSNKSFLSQLVGRLGKTHGVKYEAVQILMRPWGGYVLVLRGRD